MKSNQEIIDRLLNDARESVCRALENAKIRHVLADTYAALALVEVAAWALREEGK